MFDIELQKIFQKNKIMAVMVIDNIKDAVPAARALARGGIRLIELAWRTDISFEALLAIRENLPELTIGAGTVIKPEQVRKLAQAKVRFGVSPGTNRQVLATAKECGLAFAPGIATPSDIETALEFDCKILKFFPAEPIGSLKYLKSMAAPYEHLGLKYIPLGGLNENNFGEYLADSNILAIGGSWMLSPNLVKEHNWETITEKARKCINFADKINVRKNPNPSGIAELPSISHKPQNNTVPNY